MLWLIPAALASPLTLAQHLDQDGLDDAADALLVAGWLDGSLFTSQHPKALAILLKHAEANDDLSAISTLIDAGADLPDGVDAVHYLRGLTALEAGEQETAREHFRQVAPNARLSPRARYAEGVIFNEQDKLKSAVRSFLVTIRSEGVDPALRDRAVLNVGQIYFKIEKYENAINYFDLITSDSPVWPEALLAKAWSHNILAQYNEARGAVLTLRSPQLTGSVFMPEARHLEALLYFEHCDYTETRRLVLQTERELTPMNAELSQVAQMAPEAALERWFGPSDEPSVLPVSLFTELLADRDLRRALDREARITEELASDRLTPATRQALERAHVTTRLEAGTRLTVLAGHWSVEMRDLITQSEIVRFEIVPDRSGCTIGQRPRIEDPQRLEFIYRPPMTTTWPFDGEFWADELGYYNVELENRCW